MDNDLSTRAAKNKPWIAFVGSAKVSFNHDASLSKHMPDAV
jgi:hypothetical protein